MASRNTTASTTEANAIMSHVPAKGTVPQAQLANSQDVELKRIPSTPPTIDPEEDIMQLARIGNLAGVQRLFESGRFDATYKDEQAITPLHWAAINNQYALCKFLIDAGADVNAKGGESVATPAMWAAQKRHYYVVNLMLMNGADPLLTDVQGYNMLHLATFDGNPYLLVLLLHQNIPIDVTDPHGHTSLMWAAYKGYPIVVDLFLRWGASVDATDDQGFTALHWALVKGDQAYVSQPALQKLIEYGSDRFAETTTAKTPSITAEDMHCTGIWHRALEECGYDEDGNPTTSVLPFATYMKGNKAAMSKFFFLWPFFLLLCVFWILSAMPIFVGLPLAMFTGYSLQWVAMQALRWSPIDLKHMHRTPFLAGVFAGTAFWVGFRWLTTMLPNTFFTAPLTNIAFGISYGLCVYLYTLCMTADPGYVPKLNGRSQQKETIEELLKLWKFDEENYCMQCMVRRPLRSKHCRRCGRCVAKHDHHCPWVHNCVAINNHRHFFLYLVALFIGILLFVRITLLHLELLPDPSMTQCNIIPDDLCRQVLKDPFTIVLTGFACLQLIWVTMLLLVQLVQITRAQTTFESMRHQHHGHSHGTQGVLDTITAGVTSGTTTLEGAQLGPQGMGPDPVLTGDHSHQHQRPRRPDGWFERWKKLLGLDTFVATAQGGLDGRRGGASRDRNPFSRGIVTNCKDFLCDPAPIFGQRETGEALLGGQPVNYANMYETPPRMKARSGTRGGIQGVYQSVASDEAV